MKNLNLQVSEIMTKDFVHVSANTSMIEVDKIFKGQSFHHLPVLDQDGSPIGILSKSDYYTLLDHFTYKKIGEFERSNRMYFRSLLAQDVMVSKLVLVSEDQPIEDILDLFLKNEYHSILVTNELNKCVGICTPYDLIKWLKGSHQTSALCELL